jgi:hypothetical protein
MIKRRYGRPLRRVVVFVGQGARVPDRVEEDGQIFRYEALDLRDIQAGELIQTGNPRDLALAVLANGSNPRLSEILQRAAAMKGVQRERLLAKILLLYGALQGGGRSVKMTPWPSTQWCIALCCYCARHRGLRRRAEGHALV